MQYASRFFIIIASLVIFASCKKTNTQGRMIPNTAAIVVHINGNSLSEKLPWAAIKDNPYFKELYDDSAVTIAMKKLLDNPENSGIDIKKDMLFFIQKDSMGGYIGFEGTLKDEAAFKNFNNSLPEKGTATESDGIQYISHSPIAVGWNSKFFVYTIDAPQFGKIDELSKRMIEDSINTDSPKPRDILATCKAVFALQENSSLGKEEKFSSLIEEKGDIHLWMNTQELSTGAGTPSALAMVNLEKWFTDSRTTATLNFENGKISVNSHGYSGDELSAVFKKYQGGKIDEEMIKRIPGKDVAAVMALNFKPEGIKELLKTFNLDGFVNIGLTSLGLKMDDFIKANKGDVLIALSDFKMKPDTAEKIIEGDSAPVAPLAQKPSFNFVFATSIADKEAFNKLIVTGKKLGEKFINEVDMPLAYNSNNNYFVLSNNKETADKYMTGSNNTFDFISQISGQPFGGYVNLQSIMKAFESEAAKDSAGKIMYQASLQLWDNFLWKGGEFKDGAVTQFFEINLMDKTTNSLVQLNQYSNTLGKLYSEKRKRDTVGLNNEVAPAAPVEPATKSATKKK